MVSFLPAFHISLLNNWVSLAYLPIVNQSNLPLISLTNNKFLLNRNMELRFLFIVFKCTELAVKLQVKSSDTVLISLGDDVENYLSICCSANINITFEHIVNYCVKKILWILKELQNKKSCAYNKYSTGKWFAFAEIFQLQAHFEITMVSWVKNNKFQGSWEGLNCETCSVVIEPTES